MSQELVHIYSGEYKAYWRPNGSGYTFSTEDAGVWPRGEAESIVSGAGREKRLALTPVSDDRDAGRVYLLWEMGSLEAVVTNKGLAQQWTDSAETRGFTTELIDSQLKRAAVDMKIEQATAARNFPTDADAVA